MKKTPALVIGSGVNALGVIRNLGKEKIQVYCVSDNKGEATYSKYCKGYFIVPKIEKNQEKTIEFINRFSAHMKCKVVVFPTSDVSILNLAAARKEINKNVIVPCKLEIINNIINKIDFYKSLKKENVPHPKTFFLDNQINVDTFEMTYPVFVKPYISQNFTKKFGKKGFVAHNSEELKKYLHIVKKLEIGVIIQEIIQGTAQNHFFIDGFLDIKSQQKALFARKRLRMWPLWFGNSTVCVSVPLNQVTEMKDIVLKYFDKIKFHGIFSAEFKIDPKDDVAKLIEINARSWRKNLFPSDCGINIILKAYQDAIGTSKAESENYKTGIYLVDFFEDIKSSFMMLYKKQISFKEFITPFINEKKMTVFDTSDCMPFIINCKNNISDFFNKRKLLAH